MTLKEHLKLKEELTYKIFNEVVGYNLNLENPKTFNEKLQWLKLYYNDPLCTKCADKYEVRDYVKNLIGEEYLIPLLGAYDNAEDIDFDSLPNQFVLKVNWGSGQNIIVKDKSKLNIEDTKKTLNEWMKLKSNHYYYFYEWPYKNIKPKILCEKYMANENIENLTVYKTFCFGSKPYLFQVIIDDKTEKERINYYDLNWNKLILKQNFQNFDHDMPKPPTLDLMIEFAEKLSKGFPYFVRVDFYEVNNKIYFSEYTFYSDAGLAKFTPDDWDIKLGNLINLPKEKMIEYEYISKEELINQVTNLEPVIKERREVNNQNNVVIKEQYIPIKKYCIFNLITLFNIDLFSINKTDKYFIITILGIKISFKMQTRPDQTRPDLICKDNIYLYNNLKYKKLQPMLQYKNAA